MVKKKKGDQRWESLAHKGRRCGRCMTCRARHSTKTNPMYLSGHASLHPWRYTARSSSQGAIPSFDTNCLTLLPLSRARSRSPDHLVGALVRFVVVCVTRIGRVVVIQFFVLTSGLSRYCFLLLIAGCLLGGKEVGVYTTYTRGNRRKRNVRARECVRARAKNEVKNGRLEERGDRVFSNGEAGSEGRIWISFLDVS